MTDSNLEEWMLQCLNSCGSLGRVPLAHGSHEIDCIRTSTGYELLQRRGREVWEAELHVACQLHALWPGLLRWSPHHAADLVDLVSLQTQVTFFRYCLREFVVNLMVSLALSGTGWPEGNSLALLNASYNA